MMNIYVAKRCISTVHIVRVFSVEFFITTNYRQIWRPSLRMGIVFSIIVEVSMKK